MLRGSAAMSAGGTVPVNLPDAPAGAKGAVLHAIRVDAVAFFRNGSTPEPPFPLTVACGPSNAGGLVLVPGEWIVALPGESLPTSGLDFSISTFPSGAVDLFVEWTCTAEWRKA